MALPFEYADQRKTVMESYSRQLLEGGGELETQLVDQCFHGKISIQSIDEFLEKGGKLNAWVDYTYVYERRRWGADVPIIEWFVADKTVTEQIQYRINPFSALLYSEMPDKKKLDLSVYMLAHGANAWVRIPAEKDSLSALEYLFLEEGNNKPSAYTMALMDTLVVHGAKPSRMNLSVLGDNFNLINRMLKAGAKPTTLDLVRLFNDVDLAAFNDTNFAAIFKYNLDYSELDPSMLMATNDKPELILAPMIKNGFNVNTEYYKGFMLDAAIRYRHIEAVKLLVENGADRCRDNVNPYDYALENDELTTPQIRDYLETKFRK
jgi:hypothetical protein